MRRRLRSPTTRLALGAAVALLSLGAGAAHAQIVLMAPGVGGGDRATIDGLVEKQFGAGIDAGGRFERLRFHVGFDGRAEPSGNVHLTWHTRYTNTDYDFSSTPVAGCPSPAACFSPPPWNVVHTVDIAPGAALVLNPGLQIVAMVPMRWEGETGAEATGMTAGISAGVRLSIADRLRALVGVGVQSELEDGLAVFPVVSVDWRLTPGLRFRTTGGPYQGGGGELAWGPSRNFRMTLSAGYERSRFRINGGSTNPSGVGEYTAVPVLGGFRLGITDSGYLRVEGGMAFSGELQVIDVLGNVLRRSGFGAAGIIRGEVGLRF